MTRTTAWDRPAVMLAAGAVILALSLGIRHGFGLFLQPISDQAGWGREVFAFAIAIQNLVWGAAQPFTGRLADRFGAGPIIVVGAVLYVLGLLAMAVPQSPVMFVLTCGVLIGLGLSGTTFPIVFGAISRASSPERRSLAMGIAMAVGSFGMFVMLPTTLSGILWLDWQWTLVILAVLAGFMLPLAMPLFEQRSLVPKPSDLGAGEALRLAFAHRGFWLLSLGFFVCGFHVAFVGTHLPAYLVDQGLGAGVGSTVLALVGLVNIVGSYYAGLWGGHVRKPMLLAWIYIGRAVAIGAFVVLPVTAGSAYLFGVLMGFLWLSTVPLTNGTVATVFGVANMSMLGGIVFFMHQVGAFLGSWLGGAAYDRLGSYDAVWMTAIILALVAAALNVPIREQPVQRAAARPA
ncbi:MAG: MFS transporter [Pseudomonadota bacterium]